MDLSPARAADAGAANPPTLAWVRGGVAAAWVEGDAVRVWQRAGERWAALGDRLNKRPAAGPVRLVSLDGDTLFVIWTEINEHGVAAVRLARWLGGRWASMGRALNEPSPTSTVTTIVVTGSTQAPIVAMVVESTAQPPTTLRAVRWTGARWENAGPPSLVAAGTRVQTLGAASCGDGRGLLGWVEIGAAGTPMLELRAWSPQQNTWVVIRRADAPLIDAGTHTLAMSCDRSGALILGYGWSGGTHGIRRWDAAADAWEDLGLPREPLRGAALDTGPWLAWRAGTLFMTWRPRGGGLAAAAHRAGAWRVLHESLDDRSARGGVSALDEAGTLYVASAGPDARVSVVSLAAD